MATVALLLTGHLGFVKNLSAHEIEILKKEKEKIEGINFAFIDKLDNEGKTTESAFAGAIGGVFARRKRDRGGANPNGCGCFEGLRRKFFNRKNVEEVVVEDEPGVEKEAKTLEAQPESNFLLEMYEKAQIEGLENFAKCTLEFLTSVRRHRNCRDKFMSFGCFEKVRRAEILPRYRNCLEFREETEFEGLPFLWSLNFFKDQLGPENTRACSDADIEHWMPWESKGMEMVKGLRESWGDLEKVMPNLSQTCKEAFKISKDCTIWNCALLSGNQDLLNDCSEKFCAKKFLDLAGLPPAYGPPSADFMRNFKAGQKKELDDLSTNDGELDSSDFSSEDVVKADDDGEDDEGGALEFDASPILGQYKLKHPKFNILIIEILEGNKVNFFLDFKTDDEAISEVKEKIFEFKDLPFVVTKRRGRIVKLKTSLNSEIEDVQKFFNKFNVVVKNLPISIDLETMKMSCTFVLGVPMPKLAKVLKEDGELLINNGLAMEQSERHLYKLKGEFLPGKMLKLEGCLTGGLFNLNENFELKVQVQYKIFHCRRNNENRREILFELDEDHEIIKKFYQLTKWSPVRLPSWVELPEDDAVEDGEGSVPEELLGEDGRNHDEEAENGESSQANGQNSPTDEQVAPPANSNLATKKSVLKFRLIFDVQTKVLSFGDF